MPNNVAIRLGVEGGNAARAEFTSFKDAGTAAFTGVGDAADKTAARVRNQYDRALADAESANKRLADSMAKINAIAPASAVQMQIDRTAGTNIRYQSERDGGIGQFEGSARASAAAFGPLLAAQEEMERKANALRAALNPLLLVQQRYDEELAEARTLISQNAITLDEYSGRLVQLRTRLEAAQAAHVQQGASLGGTRALMQQASFQVQDFIVQVGSGTAATVAFAQQFPQLASAAAQADGKLQAFGNFMGGPYGIAITVAVTALSFLIPKLLGSADAADLVRERQRLLAGELDRTTGKVREQVTALQFLARARDLTSEGGKQLDTYNSARTRFLGALQQGIAPTATGERGFQIALPNAVSASGQKLLSDVFAQYQRGAINVDQAFDRINAAAGKDASLRRFAGSLRDVAISVRDAATPLNATTLEIARVAVAAGTATAAQKKYVAANTEQAGVSARLVDLQSQLRTATSDRERAQARLQIVQERGTEAAKQGGAALTAYTRDLDGARNELNRAEAAEKAAAEAKRDAAKATRAHAKELRDEARDARELLQLLTSLESAFDPAAAAARTYRANLANIDKVRSSGQIDDETAQRYRESAMRAWWEAEAAAEQSARAKVAATLSVKGDEPLAAVSKSYELDPWLGRTREAVERALDPMRELRDAGADLADRVLSPDAWNNWGSAGKSVLREIRNEFIKLALLNPIKNWLSGGKGPQLDTIGSVIGKLGGLFGSAPKNAAGTEYWSGGATWVAENGPELVSLPRGARVTPAAETRRLMAAAANDRGAPTIIINADGAVLTETVRGWVAEGIAIAATRGAAGGSEMAQAEIRAEGPRRLGRSW